MTANFQISGKAADGRIYVIGGENFQEFAANLQEIYGPQADRVIEDFNFLVDPPSPPLPQSAAPSAPAGGGQAAPPAPGAPQCAHGPRAFRSSKPGAAKQWQAWMCAAPQGTPDQCKPEWV